MTTFLLASIVALLLLALVALNRRLHAAIVSPKINADRITRDFVWVVVASAALGVVLKLLAMQS